MMRLFNKFVDAINPSRVEVVLQYRSWDEAADGWGTLYTSFHTPFGPFTAANIEAARAHAALFQIGDPE